MFERYTEKARRVIYFARAEASEFGSPTIETEHLLLGLLREDKNISNRYGGVTLSEPEIRAVLSKLTAPRAQISTSVDLPLSHESKNILAFSAEEAERFAHRHIGTEHLVAGMLREENCLAAQLLRERGLNLQGARSVLAAGVTQGMAGGEIGSGTGSVRSLPTAIDVIDAASSERVLSYRHGSLIPRIGETILIHQEGTSDRAYQVRDVVWTFHRNAGGSSLQDVIVSVHEAPSVGVSPSELKAKRPILSVAIDVKTVGEHQQLQTILGELGQRDPSTSIRTEEGSTRTILRGMDEWYLQRICERIVRDHKIKLDVGEATVIYLETIRKPAEAEGKYIRQTGGVGHYGHVKIRIEPSAADFVFVTDIKGGVVPQEYFEPIEQGIREALSGGVLGGYDIVNVKATLFDGSFHEVDSNPMAFKIAGSMALKEAARKASPIVLEPMMAVEAVTPEELRSSTIAEISRRRGRIERIANTQVIHAIVPLGEMLGADKPAWSMRFASYEPVPLRGDRGDGPANVVQPKRPTMGSGSASVRPEREFEG